MTKMLKMSIKNIDKTWVSLAILSFTIMSELISFMEIFLFNLT
jgi:hypothetical protein